VASSEARPRSGGLVPGTAPRGAPRPRQAGCLPERAVGHRHPRGRPAAGGVPRSCESAGPSPERAGHRRAGACGCGASDTDAPAPRQSTEGELCRRPSARSCRRNRRGRGAGVAVDGCGDPARGLAAEPSLGCLDKGGRGSSRRCRRGCRAGRPGPCGRAQLAAVRSGEHLGPPQQQDGSTLAGEPAGGGADGRRTATGVVPRRSAGRPGRPDRLGRGRRGLGAACTPAAAPSLTARAQLRSACGGRLSTSSRGSGRVRAKRQRMPDHARDCATRRADAVARS
jgi:hypothetical protein